MVLAQSTGSHQHGTSGGDGGELDGVRWVASCGKPCSRVTVLIVAPNTWRPLGDSTVGEVWVCSQSVVGPVSISPHHRVPYEAMPPRAMRGLEHRVNDEAGDAAMGLEGIARHVMGSHQTLYSRVQLRDVGGGFLCVPQAWPPGTGGRRRSRRKGNPMPERQGGAG